MELQHFAFILYTDSYSALAFLRVLTFSFYTLGGVVCGADGFADRSLVAIVLECGDLSCAWRRGREAGGNGDTCAVEGREVDAT